MTKNNINLEKMNLSPEVEEELRCWNDEDVFVRRTEQKLPQQMIEILLLLWLSRMI